MLRPVRRIVTGHDEHGRAVIVSDGPSPHVREVPNQPGRGLTDLWRTDRTPAGNADPGDAAATDVVLNPPPNGSVFRFFQVAPEAVLRAGATADQQAAADAAFAAMGAAHNRDPGARHPNMHKTDTVDYIILLSGRVTMLLDEGEVDLEPLDVVVQRGTNHAWVNHGDEPAVLAAVLIHAEPV